MPKINDYSVPEIGRQSEGQSSNASLRYDSGLGRSMAQFGAQLTDIGDAVYRRQAQEELSDLNAKFADARSEWTQILDEETRNGTIDTNKAKERYQEYVNKMNQGFNTSEGRNYFERESARLGQYVVKASVRGQAAVAGAKAEGAWRTALDSNSSALQSDPSEFASVYQSTIESIDEQVAVGAIPAAIADKLKRQTSSELAKSSVRGWAQLSPAIAQKKLDAGEFDQFFDGDTKAQMQGYINQQQAAKETEARRVTAAEEKARKANSEKWQNDHLNSLVNGQLPTQEIINSKALTYDDKVAMLKLQDWASKERTQTDPAVENELFRRINLPSSDPQHISDLNQLTPYVGKGLAIESVEKLNRWLDKSPAGEAMRDNRKKVIDYATARLVRKDAFGMSDPKGEYNLSQFLVDLQNEEERFRKEGKNVADLYNPHSKDYYGLQADKYKRSSKEIMQDTVAEMRRKQTINNPGMVEVIAPDGTSGKIPKTNLEKALSQGYKVK